MVSTVTFLCKCPAVFGRICTYSGAIAKMNGCNGQPFIFVIFWWMIWLPLWRSSLENTLALHDYLTPLKPLLVQSPAWMQRWTFCLECWLDSLSATPSPSSVATPPNVPVGPDPQVQPVLHSEHSLVNPRAFNDDLSQCRGFLAQCELLFTHQPSKYSADGSKIVLMMSLLTGKALSWAIGLRHQLPPV